MCSNKVAGPFWGPIRGEIRKILINLQKIFFAWTTGQNALIFSMEHPWGKEIPVCLNEILRVMYGPTLGALTFTLLVIYREMLKNLLIKNCCTNWDNIYM